MYEKERERAEYFEQLLFTKSGIVKVANNEEVDLKELSPFHKITTFSRLRHAAEVASLLRAKDKTEVADDLTEAEKIFQQELNNGLQ